MPVAGDTSTTATSPPKEYGCITCAAKFDGSEAQRAHMKGDWHVFNLRRRIESLPPTSAVELHEQSLPSTRFSDTETSPSFRRSCIACEQLYTNRRTWHAHLRSLSHIRKSAEFDSQPSTETDTPPSPRALPFKDDRSASDSEEEEDFTPRQCLFCTLESPSLEANLTHMSHAHSFFIPNAEDLIDVESLLSYLFAIISVFHECLFCGRLKNSTFGVRDHMRGKGHCKLNFEEDEELRYFYEDANKGADEGEEIPLPIEEDELHLPSGKILTRRSHARTPHPKHPSSASSSRPQHQLPSSTALPPPPPPSPDRRIVLRANTSTSLLGLSPLRQRALFAVALKMEEVEARARNEYRAGLERRGNRQKRYKVASIGKKAGGLERRLG